MGATRRLDHYEASTGWHPIFVVAAIGAAIIVMGALVQFFGLFWSIFNRKKNWDHSEGDPWNGRTLEWTTHSPPPIYNFAIIPTVNQIDPLWAIKRGEAPLVEKKYEAIHLPQNNPLPLYIGILSTLFGFAMVWYIWWLAIGSLIGIVVCLIIRLSKEDKHVVISAEEVKQMEEEYARRQKII